MYILACPLATGYVLCLFLAHTSDSIISCIFKVSKEIHDAYVIIVHSYNYTFTVTMAMPRPLTGSSSSASSSDDEIKEAFEGHTHFHYSPIMKTSLKDFKQGSPLSWGNEPLFANRPLKTLPVGHRKPKYFAQMSSAYAERPRLDFNKMQHSKRLVMASAVCLLAPPG